MAAFSRFRLFHWLLAGFFLAAYLTGDDAELAHVWLGYGLLALLVLRLLLAPFRPRGFPRLTPERPAGRRKGRAGVGRWLTCSALLSFAVAIVLGLGMVDNGEVLAETLPGVSPDVFGGGFDFLAGLGDPEDAHEFFANLALGLIGLHIGQVLLFRRPLAWSMLRGLPRSPKAAPAATEPAAGRGWQALRVSGRHQETADACSFELSGADSALAGRPGQFLTLKVPCSEPPLLRCYSLSRPPQAGQPLRITVKRVAGGRASNWLLDHLQPGSLIETLPAAGNFVPASLDRDLLLLAAGSGITPLHAILQAALGEGRGRVCLFYVNRDAASTIFAAELDALEKTYPQHLQIIHWRSERQGRADAATIAAGIAAWRHADCFVCGPQAFMESARQALESLDVPAQRIHLERFAAPLETRSAAAGGAPGKLTVGLYGRHHELPIRPGQVLLEAMEQAGLQPPQACRAGVCAACRCRVVEGRVKMRDNQALDAEQVRQGWALACQAEADSAALRIEY